MKVFKKSEISWFENSEKLTLVPGAYMKHVDKNNSDLILVICTSRDTDVTVLESRILGQGGEVKRITFALKSNLFQDLKNIT